MKTHDKTSLNIEGVVIPIALVSLTRSHQEEIVIGRCLSTEELVVVLGQILLKECGQVEVAFFLRADETRKKRH